LRHKLVTAAFAVVALTVYWGGVAFAHVTVSPSTLPKGTGDAILTFRVPNESQSASVIGLRIEFPLAHPIAVLSPEAGSGWKTTVLTARLPKPITTDDGTFTSTVEEIDWSGGTIPVGQFGEFNVLAQGLPRDTGELVFKAIQLYSDGSNVAWIQVPDKAVPDPPHPAPILQLTGAASASTQPSATTTAPQGSQAVVGGGHSDGLSVLALIVAIFAVATAVMAVWLSRPRPGSTQ
jgi:uncharacterized protein YcnI